MNVILYGEAINFILDIFAYADIFICMKGSVQLFKALGDETRLRIITLLLNGRELCVCDIMAVLELPQSTVSRHLSYLRNSGLVNDRRQGIWMYYTLRRDAIEHASALFDLLARMLSGRDQAVRDLLQLEEHLAEKEKNICS